MQEFVDTLNSIIWSNALIFLALGAGLFFSIQTRFLQVRLLREMVRLIFSGKSSEKGISTFQALSVSLSGRVGTGNIAGVAAAIAFGGPGAVFWMWIVAFFGASTAYVESTLGQIYKEEDKGQYRGGPAYYIEKAMGAKWYAISFAIITIIATGMLLPGVQANAIGNAVVEALGEGSIIETIIGPLSTTTITVTSVILVILGFIIFGGVKRIANFTQVVVPFMALSYVSIAFIIIALNITRLPEIINLIISDAFSPIAGMGAAIGWGVKRGIYSNEAGQGTGPHAAAAAEVEHPAQQGIVQAFSVYIDTLIVCSATAFMILMTRSYNVCSDAACKTNLIIQNISLDKDPNSPDFTQYALESVIPGVGAPFVAIALFFFAFTTILAYYYIAETNIAYLRRSLKIPGMMFILKIVMLISVFYGSVKTASIAWGLGDIGVGLMGWFNIIGILIIYFLAKPSLIALKDYEEQRKKQTIKYSFNPISLGIKGADFWEKRYQSNKKEDLS